MSPAAIAFAILRFGVWEAALFAAAVRLSQFLGWRKDSLPQERWLAILALQVTLESSFAAAFSFAGINTPVLYWIAAALCACAFFRARWRPAAVFSVDAALAAAILVPLLFLACKPVEEIDSINYLHYLIDWMANRATPYTFATNYVAFWELSFLPAWIVTRTDLFFPLVAAKSVILLALAVFLVGLELAIPRRLLFWSILGSLLMRHYWFLHSGIPTLKNDVLHGAGFVLLVLTVVRAARGPLGNTGLVLLSFAAAFAAVKYTGLFVAILAFALILLLRRPPLRALAGVLAFFLLTSGHYYLHNFLRDGSPFYPFQINIAFIHLPGTADLSNTSILFSLRDPRLWRALFLPEGGISPAGLLFPLILGAALVACTASAFHAAWLFVRHHTHPQPHHWVAFLILCGWFLYFRSVFSASASAGDLAFLRNNLNSVRYVDGVLALSELWLLMQILRLPALAWTMVVLNVLSRALPLYLQVPSAAFSPALIVIAALSAPLLLLAARRYAGYTAALLLLLVCPTLVQRNRLLWSTYWNDVKPQLEAVRAKGLMELGLEDGGYFAGHVVAAGNPIHPEVAALLPEDVETLPADRRPPWLAVLITPGSEAAASWKSRYLGSLQRWGYTVATEGQYGALLERKF